MVRLLDRTPPGQVARAAALLALVLGVVALGHGCGGQLDAGVVDGVVVGVDVGGDVDGGPGSVGQTGDGAAAPNGPFAATVVSFSAGDGGGFGADKLPGIVLGGPQGKGASAGSLDVVSLGCGGSIVLGLGARVLIDGPGADLLVFENPFATWIELGRVAVSDDGATWHAWPCDPADTAGGYPGCAGVAPVLANAENGVDPTDPSKAGGDAFDLADLGLKRARFIRITDTGTNACDAPTAGFDLDAVALVHSAPAP